MSSASASSRSAPPRRGPWRIFRQLLTESLLLACLGGALGALAAGWLVGLVRAVGPELPRLDQVAVDGRALVFALVASVVSALVFGALPAVRGARQPQAGRVRAAGARAAACARAVRRRLQLAAAVVLVAGSDCWAQLLEAPAREPGISTRAVCCSRRSAWPDRATPSRRDGP